MSNKPDEQVPNQDTEKQTESDRHNDPLRAVDPLDLVYKGGYSRDPQEILGNPAVAPQMIQEGRDLRVDLYRDAEEADPDNED